MIFSSVFVANKKAQYLLTKNKKFRTYRLLQLLKHQTKYIHNLIFERFFFYAHDKKFCFQSDCQKDLNFKKNNNKKWY